MLHPGSQGRIGILLDERLHLLSRDAGQAPGQVIELEVGVKRIINEFRLQFPE